MIWDPVTDTQRLYCEHSRDVVGWVRCRRVLLSHDSLLPQLLSLSLGLALEHADCVRLCVFEGRVVASVEQRYSSETESSARIRVWTTATLATETTFEESLEDQRLISVSFAPNVRLLSPALA